MKPFCLRRRIDADYKEGRLPKAVSKNRAKIPGRVSELDVGTAVETFCPGSGTAD
jgi:hypothetical protein